jgi:hypothetical protein
VGAKNPFRSLSAFPLLAKQAAVVALVFVFLSAISTADDDVQQEALAQPQLHIFRVCRPVPPAVVSAALVAASSYRFEAISRCIRKVHELELLVPLAESLCPLPGRSPPLTFSLSLSFSRPITYGLL